MAGGAAGAQGSNTLGTPSTGAATPGMQQPQGGALGQLMQQPGATGGLGGMLGQLQSGGGQTPPNPFLGQGLNFNATGTPAPTPGPMAPGFGPGVDNFDPGARKISNTYPGMDAMQPQQQAAPRPLTQPLPPGFSGPGAPPPPGGMRPMQPLDTSEQAYRKFMASVLFAPGSTPPTYEQWSQSMQNRPQIPSMADPRIQQSQTQPLPPDPRVGPGAPPPMMTNYGPGTTGGIESSPLSAYAQQLAQSQGVFGRPRGMPQRGFPGPRPKPFPQQGGAGARTPLQGLGGLQQLMAQQNPDAYK